MEETTYWLVLLAKAKIVAASRLQPLREEADELLRIFVSAVNTAKQERNR